MFTDLIIPLVDTGKKTEMLLKLMKVDNKFISELLKTKIPPFSFYVPDGMCSNNTIDRLNVGLRDMMPKEFTEYLSEHSRADVIDKLRKYGEITTHSAYVEFLSKPDWKPGDFAGDSGSCWWGGKSHGRKMMQTNGGLALKFSTGLAERPRARCWGVNVEDNLVIFNLYEGKPIFPYPSGTDRLLAVGAAIALGFETEASKLYSLVNNRKSSDMFHINRGDGVLIGAKAEKYCNSTVDLKWKVENFVKCSFCGTELDAGKEIFYDGGDKAACEPHAEDHLDLCTFDKTLYDTRRLRRGPDEKLYYSLNLMKVPDFVPVYKSSEFAFKKDAHNLGRDVDGKEVWVLNPNAKLCPECKSTIISKNEDRCRYCAPIDDILLKLKPYMVFPVEFSFSLPDDLGRLEQTIKTLKATSLVEA